MMLGVVFYMACHEDALPREPSSFEASERASVGCSSTCETDVQPIREEDWLVALDAWRSQPLGLASIELETLLFYGKESKNWLPVYGKELPVAHRRYLEKELARDQVAVEMRLIDENGEIRGTLAPPAFHLKEKQHLPFSETGTLGFFEASGKVKRVGVSHLWSRW